MPEHQWSNDSLTSFNALFATAVTKNINIFCATGDKGSYNGGETLSVNFPASSPNVIACGGTRVDSNGYSIKEESVWNNFPTNPNTKSATGGGISKVFSKPLYQKNIQSNTNMRCVPDIASNADPKTGYLIFISGGYGIIGGTRCVPPMMAGLTARINEAKGKNIGFINNKLYTTNVCSLIKKGNNGAYTANADGSYSLTCGLGRINGKQAVKLF
jgi:kumamolisin